MSSEVVMALMRSFQEPAADEDQARASGDPKKRVAVWRHVVVEERVGAPPQLADQGPGGRVRRVLRETR
jgi:hypothetical protein